MRLIITGLVVVLLTVLIGCHQPTTVGGPCPQTLVDAGAACKRDTPAVWLLFLDESGDPLSSSSGTVRRSDELLVSLHQLPPFANKVGASGGLIVDGTPCRYTVCSIIPTSVPSAGGCAQLRLDGLSLDAKVVFKEDYRRPLPIGTQLYIAGVPQGKPGAHLDGPLSTSVRIVPVTVIDRQKLDADGQLREFVIVQAKEQVGGASGGPVFILDGVLDGDKSVPICVGILGGAVEGVDEQGRVVDLFPLVYRPDSSLLR